jgi:hypothetical protein
MKCPNCQMENREGAKSILAQSNLNLGLLHKAKQKKKRPGDSWRRLSDFSRSMRRMFI